MTTATTTAELDEAAVLFRSAAADADAILADTAIRDAVKASALSDKLRAADGLVRIAEARRRLAESSGN